MLALTVSLGVWQIHRLAWKTAILAEISRAEQAPPVPLGSNVSAFQRVTVEGRYLPSAAFYGADVRGTSQGPQMGAALVSPLQRPGEQPVMVDRGWAPAGFDALPPPGEHRLIGYIRPPEYSVRFGAKDDPATKHFYALDPAAIGKALGLNEVAPYTLVLLGPKDGLPEAAVSLPRPPNDHLSYAITWFALSAALVLIFIIYARAAIRSDAPK